MLATKFILPLALTSFTILTAVGRKDVWIDVPCNKEFIPDDCDFDTLISDYLTIEEFDRCGPASIPIAYRNYYLGAAGRSITYKDNKDAFDRIRLKPKMLRDVSVNSIKTTVLGLDVDFPFGLSPVSMHKLAHPEGEKATVAGLSSIRTVMVLSSYASTSIEDVAAAARGQNLHLWMQTLIFQNRNITIDLVQRAQKSGFKAIVLTVDSPLSTTIRCGARGALHYPPGVRSVNLDGFKSLTKASANFDAITWVKGITNLPIVVKGILSGEDAKRAIWAGASAIYVSNHGGRTLDGVPATIDALPDVVDAMQSFYPPPEVYMDGGVRSGNDAFKAIARGAKMVFYGRPNIWGLALGGSIGVKRVINIFESQFKETMLLAGISKVSDITRDTLLETSWPQNQIHPPDNFFDL